MNSVEQQASAGKAVLSKVLQARLNRGTSSTLANALPTEDSIQVGERIRWQRLAAKLTRDEVADHINVTTDLVAQIEDGAAYPPITVLADLCALIGATTDYVLTGIDHVNSLRIKPAGMTFSVNVVELLCAQKKNPESAAEEWGIPASLLTSICCGDLIPDLNTAESIARSFGHELHEFLQLRLNTPF